MVSTGGTKVSDDFYRLSQTVHVIVATPGRILDLASKNVANLDPLQLSQLTRATLPKGTETNTMRNSETNTKTKAEMFSISINF